MTYTKHTRYGIPEPAKIPGLDAPPAAVVPTSDAELAARRDERRKRMRSIRGWTPEARQRAAQSARRAWTARRQAHQRPNPVLQLRTALDVTQGEFASLIGLSPNNQGRISNFENGLHVPANLRRRMNEVAADRKLPLPYKEEG